MLQRKAPAGRPTGTDGSDYSYRMVVDSRYTKVAKGKSRLKALLIVQGVLQAIGSLLVLLASREKGFKNLLVVSVSIGFISLLIGELGRRRSQANSLRLYVSLLAIEIAFTAARVVKSDLFLKVYKHISLFLVGAVKSCSGVIGLFFRLICNNVNNSGFIMDMREVTKEKDFSSITSYELGETVFILLGVLLHILAIITAALLLQNMSPKRTA